MRRSKKTSKHCVTGICVGNPPVTAGSPHKGPVTRKMFPSDDVIIHTDFFLLNHGHHGCKRVRIHTNWQTRQELCKEIALQCVRYYYAAAWFHQYLYFVSTGIHLSGLLQAMSSWSGLLNPFISPFRNVLAFEKNTGYILWTVESLQYLAVMIFNR